MLDIVIKVSSRSPARFRGRGTEGVGDIMEEGVKERGEGKGLAAMAVRDGRDKERGRGALEGRGG